MKKNQYNLRKIFQNNESLSPNDIENYLQDSMTDDDRFRIENTLLDSPLDADAVEGFEAANYSFAQKKPYADFHSFMEKMDNAPSAKIVPMRPRQKMIRRLAVAASFLVLLAAGWFVMNNSSGATNDDLYANYFTTFDNDLPEWRGAEDDEITIMQNFDRAMEEYSTGQYAESLPFFEEYLISEPDSHFAMFYSGMAHLEVGNFDKAIMRLEQAIATEEEKNYREKAKWYLILAHLKKGDRAIAAEKLSAYVKGGATFKNAGAKELLQQIAH